jgi:D-alanyl-D-alanine carboxypeptidase
VEEAIAGLLVVIAAIAAVLGYQTLASSSSTDGAVPDGTTVFDDEVPGVANLDPDLLGALRQAATHAADDGVEFFVDSGWRSPDYQEQLLHEAVVKHGSEEEAARWVATPKTSAHVSGDAGVLRREARSEDAAVTRSAPGSTRMRSAWMDGTQTCSVGR